MVENENPTEYIQGTFEKRRTVHNIEVSRVCTIKIALQKFIAFRFSGYKFDVILEIYDHFSVEAFLDALPSAQMISLSQFRIPRLLRINIFEDEVYFTDWPYSLSASGHAVTFSSRNLGNEESQNDDHEKLNLWAKNFHRDFSPICEKCSCNTCKHHSRSYIHHLLGVHEISALILLAEHNMYQFKKKLEEFRVSVKCSAE